MSDTKYRIKQKYRDFIKTLKYVVHFRKGAMVLQLQYIKEKTYFKQLL